MDGGQLMQLSGKRQTTDVVVWQTAATDVVVGWQIVFVRERMSDIGNCLVPLSKEGHDNGISIPKMLPKKCGT